MDREARARRIYNLVLGLLLVGSLVALAWPKFFGREVGEACDADWLCKAHTHCLQPDGYCTKLCVDDSECPNGLVCRPARSDIRIGRDSRTSLATHACQR